MFVLTRVPRLIVVLTVVLAFPAGVAGQAAPARATSVEVGSGGLRLVTLDEADERDVAFAPRGEGIAVTSNRSGSWEIWYYPLRSGGIRQLTMNVPNVHDVAPDWHPNGQMIVFQSTRVDGLSNIWRLGLGERGLTQLTTLRFGAERPRYSPEGRLIAFAAYSRDGSRSIWVMDADGRNQSQLSDGFDPSWTPDGQRIVFARLARPGADTGADIWIMDFDGRNAQRLTAERLKSETAPRVSPDGRRIAYVVTYVAQRDSARALPAGVVQSELWVMDADGTNQRQVLLAGDFPAWQPDGLYIAVAANRAGSMDIWLLQPSIGSATGLRP